MSGTFEEPPPEKPDIRSSAIGIGALIGVLALVLVLFVATSPDEIEPEQTFEATPTPVAEPTASPTPEPEPSPEPEATDTPPTPTPTPDLAALFESLDLGPGRLLIAEPGEVASYDLDTGERETIIDQVLYSSVFPIVSWRGISWRPINGARWVTNFWGGDLEQSPLPLDFDPSFAVSAPHGGLVYTEVVFGSIDGGGQLLATHLATGEDVLIDLPSDVRQQVLAGWPPQIRALRDTLYISSGARIYRWRFSAREWVDLGPGTLVGTTGPGIVVTDCSIDSCSVRSIGPDGESVEQPSIDAGRLPGGSGEFAAINADGSRLAFATVGTSPTLRGQRMIRILDVDNGITRDVALDDQNTSALHVSWTPTDSNLLVVLQADGPSRQTRLMLLNPDTGGQLDLPFNLDPNQPFALTVDVDRLRGLPAG